jgi:hypothetical protein
MKSSSRSTAVKSCSKRGKFRLKGVFIKVFAESDFKKEISANRESFRIRRLDFFARANENKSLTSRPDFQ